MNISSELGPVIDFRGQVRYTGLIANKSYPLNSLFSSFTSEDNRKAFDLDAMSYLQKFELSQEEQEMVLTRDWQALFVYGVNIYALAKACVALGGTMQELAIAMRALDR
jgi:protocatechuate 4,5-dioxygenase alpha chain